MTAFRRPFFWSRLPWTQKAAYLLSSNQARTYEEACSMLASPRRRSKSVPIVRLPYKDSLD